MSPALTSRPFACCMFLIAFLLQWNFARADSITVPVTKVYRGGVTIYNCTASYGQNFAFPTLEQAVQLIIATKASAINCSLGKIWYYDLVSVTVDVGSFAVFGRSQYDGTTGQIGGGAVQRDCLPQTNVGATTCSYVSPNDQLYINGVSQKPKLDICPSCGNPIVSATGNKFQTEADYRSSSVSPLSFSRLYNSIRQVGTNGPGYVWRHTFQRRIFTATTFDNKVMYSVERPNSDHRQFVVISGVAQPRDAEVIDKLELLYDATAALTGFRFTNSADDSVELFDAAGKLLSITSRSGLVQTLTYTDGTATGAAGGPILDSAGQPIANPALPLPAGLLLRVTDNFSKSLSFGYDITQRIVSITDPNGTIFSYGYDESSGNLISVTFPDNKVRRYSYNEAAYTGNTNQPYALTGIVDENNVRFATFYYDAQGRGISTEHAGGVEKNQLSYPTPNVQSAVLDGLNTSRGYSFTTILGMIRNTSVTQPCGTPGCTGTVSTSLTYDANGNIASRTDFNGNRTNYVFDLSRNLETSRTEGLTAAGATTPATRTTTTTWHPTFRLPATITEPTSTGDRVTTYTYDASGNALSKSVSVAATTRTWNWTYDAYGRVLTATDPRGKITTNTYYPNTAAQNTTLANSRGLLASVSNALNQTVNITGYNPHGQPLTMTDANGLTTTMTYDVRQRLTSRTVGSETTTYTYDGVGQLIKVTLPDSSTLTYTYDGAHRLTQIADGLGNKVIYTLDNIGNRTAESYYDPASVLARTRTRVYDPLNRLQKDIGGADPTNQVSQYAYDSNGNMTGMTDPLTRITTQGYDALNRLLQVIDPVNGSAAPTKYEYDAQDNLTKVTDPKTLATTYSYNGFNELLTQTSPDTGATSFTYDAVGNLLTKTDARGVTATYTYDNLNRVATISYPAYQSDPAETVTYTYDGPSTSCGYGVGRLCSLSDKTGTTAWRYDLQGRILSKAQTLGGVTQTVAYSYNSAGQMSSMTLPSGKPVTYTYRNNRVTGVTVDGVPVVKSADYEPFGPIGDWVWGNDSTANPNKHIRYFDLDGRNTKIASGAAIDPAIIVYDAASRITALQRLTGSTVDPAKSNTYGYDNLDRLTAVTPNTGNPNQPRSYSYDGIGNRLTDTLASATTTYSYGTTSQRLQSLSGATAKTFGYDNAGNKISDGVQSWSYGGNNRPTTISVSGVPLTTIQAGINALGQRVTKTVNGVITRFVYDEQGKLVGEYNADGSRIREHLWFNDLPVGVLK